MRVVVQDPARDSGRVTIALLKGATVDKEELKAKGKQAQGKAQEYAGKVTGDEEQEAEGRAKNMEGDIQEKAGDLADKARELGRKVTGN
jgi:uncharacterized protein YjbJ (UPF0337 family)